MNVNKLEYNYLFKKIINNNMVVIANRDNGKWIKISKECFDVLDIAINKEWTRNELIENLENGDDRKYFEQLLNKLLNFPSKHFQIKPE